MRPPIENFFTFGDGLILGATVSAFAIVLFTILVGILRRKGLL